MSSWKFALILYGIVIAIVAGFIFGLKLLRDIEGGTTSEAKRQTEPKGALGETTYQRFKRLIDALPEYEQENFMARIIARFAELHDLELRDILLEEHSVSLDKVAEDIS